MTAAKNRGRCFCGAVQFEVGGVASSQCICHCASCRRAAGAPFVAWTTFPSALFTVTAGTLTEKQTSAHALRGFCADCGSSLTYRHTGRPDEIDVTTVTLDAAECFPPDRHIWVEDKLPWIALSDALPQFARWSKGD